MTISQGLDLIHSADHPSDADEPESKPAPVLKPRDLLAQVWQRGRDAKLGTRNPFLTFDPNTPLSMQEMCRDIWDDGHSALPDDPNPYTLDLSNEELKMIVDAGREEVRLSSPLEQYTIKASSR